VADNPNCFRGQTFSRRTLCFDCPVGGYEEAGDHGRFRVGAGDVIFHERFEAHLDRFSPGGAMVLNLNLCADWSPLPGLARVTEVDGLVRIAEKDQNEALNFFRAGNGERRLGRAFFFVGVRPPPVRRDRPLTTF